MIDPARLSALKQRENRLYQERTPRSAQLAREAALNWPGSVPMHWMKDWPMPHPLFVASAHGATLTDVDGHSYADFCLGDTGAMFGHAPAPVAQALASVATHGFTFMLPTETIVRVGRLLEKIFGLQNWQTCLTASDANRSVIRWARAITGRNKLLIFNGCYHGAVDDVFTELKNGVLQHRSGLVGQVYDLTEHSCMAEFNDVDAVEALLAKGDVAAILTEPALTNIGMVEPAEGFLAFLRAASRKHGSLLILDETHTVSHSLGGYTKAYDLQPDFLVIGKAIAGGLPAAVFGFTQQIAQEMQRVLAAKPSGYSGIGTTLSGNALSLAAMEALLEKVMTAENYAYMTSIASLLKSGLQSAIPRSLPWHVLQVGARVEFVFANPPPRNGIEAKRAMHPALEAYLHLYLLNRGVIITPFHNMMLASPATSRDHVHQLVTAFAQCLAELTNNGAQNHAA